MTSKQRAFLKSLAINVPASIQIGKFGLTPEVTKAVDEAFNTKEIVKLSVLQSCLEPINEMAATLAERTGSQVVQVIGRKIVLYREGRGENKKIELPTTKGR